MKRYIVILALAFVVLLLIGFKGGEYLSMPRVTRIAVDYVCISKHGCVLKMNEKEVINSNTKNEVLRDFRDSTIRINQDPQDRPEHLWRQNLYSLFSEDRVDKEGFAPGIIIYNSTKESIPDSSLIGV
ncbi:hypothetical protein [Porphyromonas pogonae]|uniref:hypothetical protein n=1 Tax=Porphyromonas pogonae TaxID=867595 RepID=UPI002E799B3F|nr:hypothetical protein [Porphyromonas pogonae]